MFSEAFSFKWDFHAHLHRQGEFLLDEEGWKDEARGVIQDISAYVRSVSVAEKLPSTSSQIFLNLTTKENNQYTIVLNSEGFKIVGHSHDTSDIEGWNIEMILDNLIQAFF